MSFLLVILGVTFGTLAVQAQPYPSRPIQLVVPNVPGSVLDISARLFAEELGKILGTPVVAINKPGASGTLGTDVVVKSKKDGYTLAYTNVAALVYARVLNPETVPYDSTKDLEPLGLHLYFPIAVTVQESSPWKTFPDLIDYARKNPGKLRAGTRGVGSTDYFNMEITQSLTGAQFTHVPFKGGESVITAVLGGHVELIYDALSKSTPHVDSGKLRVLLTTKKAPDYPKIPTITELGYKQDLLSPWYAVLAPAGIPDEVKKVLVPAVEKTIKDPELKAKVEKLEGFIVDYKPPAELKTLMIEEYEKGLAIAEKVGLRKKN
jgi:tripartite-type tricarboxylate transporter receptor subunit TctC